MYVKDSSKSKSELRKSFLSERNNMSKEQVFQSSLEIASRFICSADYAAADLLLIYVSAGNEVYTKGIISAAFANKKKVAVPVCKDKGVMDFYLINSFAELKEGRFGIEEPEPEKCKKAEITENTVCVVPAISFDAKGYRLGRGGGYYDRFLADFKGRSVGLCYHKDFVLSLPHDGYDMPVNLVITENFSKEMPPKAIGGL